MCFTKDPIYKCAWNMSKHWAVTKHIGVILLFLCFCEIKLIYNTLCPEMEHFLLKLWRISPITTTIPDIFITGLSWCQVKWFNRWWQYFRPAKTRRSIVRLRQIWLCGCACWWVFKISDKNAIWLACSLMSLLSVCSEHVNEHHPEVHPECHPETERVRES